MGETSSWVFCANSPVIEERGAGGCGSCYESVGDMLQHFATHGRQAERRGGPIVIDKWGRSRRKLTALRSSELLGVGAG